MFVFAFVYDSPYSISLWFISIAFIILLTTNNFACLFTQFACALFISKWYIEFKSTCHGLNRKYTLPLCVKFYFNCFLVVLSYIVHILFKIFGLYLAWTVGVCLLNPSFDKIKYSSRFYQTMQEANKLYQHHYC